MTPAQPRKRVDYVAILLALLALLSQAASGYFHNDKTQSVALATLQQAHDDDRATIAEIKQRLQALDEKLDQLILKQR